MNVIQTIVRATVLIAALSSSVAHAALIELFKDGSSVTNLAQADALIAAGGPIATTNTSVIEFDDLGDGTQGNFNINNAFPGGITSDFALQVSGLFSVSSAETRTFEINHDDGMYVLLDGAQVAFADGVVDNRNTQFTVALAAGVHVMEIIFFEHLGGASLELASFDNTGARYLFELADPISSVPEPGTIGLLGIGLLGLALARRKQAA